MPKLLCCVHNGSSRFLPLKATTLEAARAEADDLASGYSDDPIATMHRAFSYAEVLTENSACILDSLDITGAFN